MYVIINYTFFLLIFFFIYFILLLESRELKMNRTRKIYFLAAFVLIIGCYALNKSYSLFVDTQEKEAVSSSVPALFSDISVKNVVLQPYEEIILKETVSNSSDVPVSYTLNSSSNSSSIVNLLNFEDNESFGLINPNEKREIYLYLKNEYRVSIFSFLYI